MNINITYIDHSGFLMEWDDCYWLFDYYKGHIPSLDNNKILIVFVSHSHSDHFNPEIFNLYKSHSKIKYLISSDINLDDKNKAKYGITDELSSRIKEVSPGCKYEISVDNYCIEVNTLKSTDKGVAFLNYYKGKTIYHAGDLNLWVWKEEDKQYNNDMKARFQKEISKLKNQKIDMAFVPLDPRQEEWYGLGMDALLDCAKVRYVFPMHFWDKPETIQMYKKERVSKPSSATIFDVENQGQYWSIEI